MPQYLSIETRHSLVGKMSTSHRSGTCYDVLWQGPEGLEVRFSNVDTGIQRQPSDHKERQRDFRNDFAHARRAIGAAAMTAMRFLGALPRSSTEGGSGEGVRICLRTNQVDRGVISIVVQQNQRARVHMAIGTGPTRPANAQPAEVVEFIREDVHIPATVSVLALALHVLAVEGSWLLDVLDGR